jgi:DNA-binding transcriptional LysR family regulator
VQERGRRGASRSRGSIVRSPERSVQRNDLIDRLIDPRNDGSGDPCSDPRLAAPGAAWIAAVHPAAAARSHEERLEADRKIADPPPGRVEHGVRDRRRDPAQPLPGARLLHANPAVRKYARFLLMMPDLVVETLMPPLLARVSAEAPQVRLDIVPWRIRLSDELARSLDLAICCTAGALTGFHRQRLYSDTDVLAVRRGHPVGAGLARMPRFLAARHVAVIGTDRTADYIDAWLRDQGIERRIALTVPSYLQALRVAAQTDLVAFVPSRLVAALRGPLALQGIRPPLDPGIDVQVMAFPRRAHADPASSWLRTLIAEIADRLPRALGLQTGRRTAARRPAVAAR